MSFRLQGFLSDAAKAAGADSKNTAQVSEQPSGNSGRGGARELLPGQTVSGEVISRDGREIRIMIDRDRVLNARLEQDLRAAIGQTVSFQVKSNSSGTLALRPLFENLAQETNALKALSAAGIPTDPQSMGMVSAMMEEGMSIDCNSLQQMYRQIMNFRGSNPIDIVQMNRLQIPVTKESLEQFQAYKNYEHKLADGVSQISGEIPGTYAELFSQGGTGAAFSFMEDIFSVFIEKTAGEDGAQDGAAPENGQTVNGEGKTAGQEDGVILQEARDGGEGAGKAAGEIKAGQMEARKPESLQKPDSAAEGNVQAHTDESGELRQLLNQADREMMAQFLEEAGARPEDVQRLRQGILTPGELLSLAGKLLEQAAQENSRIFQEGEHGVIQKGNSHHEGLHRLFSSEGFQKALSSEIVRQWMITPENVGREKEVVQLYDRLRMQTNQLLRSLSESVKGDSPMLRSLNSMKENVEFINQLNQVYSYVQLPLKTMGGKAHGDLYVYTNKKNLAKKDGNVSAFLHLDMEHLGAVDVYVAMQSGRVNTNFYFEDEDVLSLVERNLSSLTERIRAKGYQAETKVMFREKETNVMQEILETDKNISVMSAFAFDVRA